MKKLTTVLLAAGLLVSASACTAPKLTTKETCERLNLVVSNPGTGKPAMNRIANALRPLEAVASDELQPSLKALLEYADESAKQNPDEAKLGDLTAEYQKAGAKFSELCSGA